MQQAWEAAPRLGRAAGRCRRGVTVLPSVARKTAQLYPPMIATPRVDTVASPQEQQPRPSCALNRRSICATPAASLPAARLPLRLSAESGHSGFTDQAWHRASAALRRTGQPACR